MQNELVVEPTQLKNMHLNLDHETPTRGEHKKYLKFHHLEKNIPQQNHLPKGNPVAHNQPNAQVSAANKAVLLRFIFLNHLLSLNSGLFEDFTQILIQLSRSLP